MEQSLANHRDDVSTNLLDGIHVSLKDMLHLNETKTKAAAR
tara:strand:- start:2413 stop:2535 length:123 start_codon:yes stop_codon:yes gene_type:complete